MHGGYGLSRHWVDPGADGFIGATPQICEAARKIGMPPDRLIYGGFLLDPNFYSPPADESVIKELRTALDLSENVFTLLLSTGANGAVNHLDFLEALKNSGLELQVIALCGQNTAAQSAIEEWSRHSPKIRVRPLGHRKDMAALMQISDLIVARPGTGTTSEAIMMQCPILFNTMGGIMPQEWITVKYLRSEGLEAPCIKTPSDLPNFLRPLLKDSGQVIQLKSQMETLRPPAHPELIIQYLTALVSKVATEN
jgi:processive 1,2-diacylglycerol beta-glucosyltransferase